MEQRLPISILWSRPGAHHATVSFQSLVETERLTFTPWNPVFRATSASDELTPHEANYNLIAAAIATAAATMLTTLGTVEIVSRSALLKGLLEAELLVIEFSLLVSVVALLRRGQVEKRTLVLGSPFLLILGTLLLWLSATTIIYG